MNDFLWIAFIIIIYLVVIKPMIQGIMQNPKPPVDQNKQQTEKPGKAGNADSNNRDKEYVDYEEIK